MFVSRYAERRADYGEQGETSPCDFLRRSNFILDSILRVIHIDSRFAALLRLHYSITCTRGQMNDPIAIGRESLRRAQSGHSWLMNSSSAATTTGQNDMIST
jgi:hypothetical protein